jgi:uncharacterized membrane protein
MRRFFAIARTAQTMSIPARKVMMSKGRLEAFSDGVIAVVITIMVLELKVPHGNDWSALQPLIQKFISYAMSFLYVGIYWNNHHHLLKACREVNAAIMWFNLLLLFFISLIPFVTAWLGESNYSAHPAALYSIVLLLSALAYYLLQSAIVRQHDSDSRLLSALGRDYKGKLSPLTYVAALILSLAGFPVIATVLNAVVAMIWLLPDRRIEKALRECNANKVPQ